MAETWNPLYPDIARTPNAGSDREWEVGELNDSGQLPWVQAPSTSESVHSFRLYDADDPKLKRFIQRFMNGESQLQIRFKPSGKRGITEYTYYFRDRKEARDVFAALQSTDHPGHVVYQRLKLTGVDYQKTGEE
jgi:hypothetical protein